MARREDHRPRPQPAPPLILARDNRQDVTLAVKVAARFQGCICDADVIFDQGQVICAHDSWCALYPHNA